MADTSRLRQVAGSVRDAGPHAGGEVRPSRSIDHTIREGFLTIGDAVGPAVEVARQREPVVQAPPIPVQRVSSPVVEARPTAPVPPSSAARPAPARPAVSFRHDGPPTALEGSTIVETAARIAAAGGRQRSVVLIRVRVPAGLAGPGQHVFELRALILANGRDIIRYTIYRDPSAAHGFEAKGPCGLAIELREAQVFGPNAERPAEAHLRYEGVLRLPSGGAVRFHGLVLMDGAGLVRAVDPTVDGGGAIGRIQDGTIEITWP